jgi:hypothetical protein
MSHDITFAARRAGLRGHALASDALHARGPQLVSAAVTALRNFLLECDAAPVLHSAFIRGKALAAPGWSMSALDDFAHRLRRGESGVSSDGRAVCLSLRGERIVAVLGGPSAAWLTLASEWSDADFHLRARGKLS